MARKTTTTTEAAPAPAPAPSETSTTPSILEVAVNGLNASAAAISKVIAEGKNDENSKVKVRVNVLHLEHGIASDIIKQTKTDTKVFVDAIAAGKAFLS